MSFVNFRDDFVIRHYLIFQFRLFLTSVTFSSYILTAFCLLLTSCLSKRFWQEIYVFEAFSCLLETLNCKNFVKTLLYLQGIRKSKPKVVFLSLKLIFSSVLTSLTKSRPYLFLKTPIRKSEHGNLIRVMNRTKVAIHSAVDPNAIFNTKKPR